MPCCLMHWAAACSSAARPAHEPWAEADWLLDAPGLAAWLPWPAAWLRLGTAAGLEPEPAHPATSSAPATAARMYLLFLIWTSRVGPGGPDGTSCTLPPMTQALHKTGRLPTPRDGSGPPSPR